MRSSAVPRFTKRYRLVTKEKAGGATYTPVILADFVASQIARAAEGSLDKRPLRILDPAIGHGELLLSLVKQLGPDRHIEVHGFDIHPEAVEVAHNRLSALGGKLSLKLTEGDFLQHVLEQFGDSQPSLFSDAPTSERYDLIIANPPYVRTQIMGSIHAQMLAQRYELTGRVDLYYAFLVSLSQVLAPHGVAGVIVSNRFMTTRAGAAVREAVRSRFDLKQVWDLGDTKLFEAAVLPSVLLLGGKNGTNSPSTGFSTIYETEAPATLAAINPIAALNHEGIVEVPDGRHFEVRHGRLDHDASQPQDVWRLGSQSTDAWLETVKKNTWATFGEIGKIRVGVKTCADKVFMRSDWSSLPADSQPELLRPLTTHHIARRFRSFEPEAHILYPHEITEQGRRAPVDLEKYPASRRYLNAHRDALEGRRYVIEAGRQWYEIWVAQDPAAWNKPKLVFRDISEEPMFWIDRAATVVNGDCYWMINERDDDENLLFLAAAVANTTFAERFYDHRFNNKLYAGRRRFITQYVKEFPVPNPDTPIGREIIAGAKLLYDHIDSPEREAMERALSALVYKAFGLGEEAGR
jgi:adenine-specific DNA-methyltransferase